MRFARLQIILTTIFLLQGCRDGHFESKELFTVSQYPTLSFQNLSTSNCDSTPEPCRIFKLDLELLGHEQKKLILFDDALQWRHPQLKNIRWEAIGPFRVHVSGEVSIDPENPYSQLISQLSLRTAGHERLTYSVVIQPHENPFILSSEIKPNSFSPSTLDEKITSIVLNQVNARVSSSEMTASLEETFSLDLHFNFGLVSGKSFGTRSATFSVLYPSEQSHNVQTDALGNAHIPLMLSYNPYDHDEFTPAVIKIEFDRVRNQKPIIVSLKFNLEKDSHETLVDYKISEQVSDEILTFKKNSFNGLLTLDLDELAFDQTTTAPIPNDEFSISGLLRVVRKNSRQSYVKPLKNRLLHADLFIINSEGPNGDVLNQTRWQAQTDDEGRFHFLFRELINPKIPFATENKLILRLTIPDLPKAEKIYLMMTPSTGVITRYRQDQIPPDIK